ncbi:leukocyte elastase inhibitor-like [Hetaerina americana]|uniref:leukocyte elastase inhibitor-like n=1 Tax=Hetaerina americana TaxID=62018 RepID=UPI003A7F365B
MTRAIFFVPLIFAAMLHISLADPDEVEKLKLQANIDRSAFFDVELLQELSKLPGVGHGNVLLSPISIKLALGMLWEGAGPYAAHEIRLALRLPENRQEVQTYFSSVLRSLQGKSSGPGYTLDLANRLYVTDSLLPTDDRRNNTQSNRVSGTNRPSTSSGANRNPAATSSSSKPQPTRPANQASRPNTPTHRPHPAPVLEPNFVRAITLYYGAEVTFADFSKSSETAAAINGWASDVTHGLIPEIVSPDAVSPDTQLFLGNVVYFKGAWEYAFNPQNSKPGTFYLPSGDEFQATMMEQLNYFKYAEIDGLNAKALELPYEGNKFAMLLLLPNERQGMAQMLRDLPHNPLSSIVAQLELREVQVAIPRFQADFNLDMVAPLRSLGIEHIFLSLEGSLPGISTRVPLKVDGIQHTVKIIVNEQGSEAAGATGILVVPLMGASVPKFEADHSFLFFIRDLETGAFLFAGKMAHPHSTGAGHAISSQGNPSARPVSQQEEQAISSIFKNPGQTAPTTSPPKRGANYLPPSQTAHSSQRRGRMAFYPGVRYEDFLVFEQ